MVRSLISVQSGYARGQHYQERVAMAQWWSNHLVYALRDGTDVVPLRREARR
jgi:hypothetical protein